jgi:hypothetical protein
MDLVRQLNDAELLRPEAYRRARAALREAMVASATTAPETSYRPGADPAPRVLTREVSRDGRRRRTLGTLGKAGIGAGIGLVAAAVAVAVVVTSAHGPAAPAGTAAQAPAAASPLTSLAALIKSSAGKVPGDASLIIRTQTITGIGTTVSYNLYADNGAFYGGGDRASLREAVSKHQDLSGGMQAREVAAAEYAASGNLTKAREQMINALPNSWGLGLSPSRQQAIWNKAVAANREVYQEKGIPLPKRPTGQKLQDDLNNNVWNNSVDALSAGAGNPQVRAGVLRLLSTIKAVSVAHSTAGGQPALTLTAGSALFGGEQKQVLTVNAKTGMPISSVVPAQGKLPQSVQTFKVSRLTVAGVAAGKF